MKKARIIVWLAMLTILMGILTGCGTDEEKTQIIRVAFNLMIGLSSIMSWVMAFTGLPDLIASAILSMTGSRYIILILMNIILLFVGTFMDPTPAVLIFTQFFCRSVRNLVCTRCSLVSWSV